MARSKLTLACCLVAAFSGAVARAGNNDKIISCCENRGVCRNEILESDCALVGNSLGEDVSCADDPDEDGLVGCDDLCPLDPKKTEPGICGCGWGEPLLLAEKRCGWTLVGSYPEPCANDPSCPYDADDHYIGGGIDFFELRFDPVVDVNTLTPADFTIQTFHGVVDYTPVVDSVSPIDATTALVTLSTPIPVYRTTCLYFTEGAPDEPLLCVSRQPGDVNNSGRPNAMDVLDLIDSLNGVIRLEPWQCDVDSSGVCNATDILEVVDVLNGIKCQIYTYLPNNLPCPPEVNP